MPWKVRKLDDTTPGRLAIHCVSVHMTEEAAKMDVGRHLAGLIELVRKKLPLIRRQSMATYPGFMKAAETLVEDIGRELAADDPFGAYDLWWAFMGRWSNALGVQGLWPGIGTVIMEGPGPWMQIQAPEIYRKPLFNPEILKERRKETAIQEMERSLDQAIAAIAPILVGEVRAGRLSKQDAVERLSSELDRIGSGFGFEDMTEVARMAIESRLGRRPTEMGRPELGAAAHRWRITFLAPGMTSHASVHMNEETAIQEIESTLDDILRSAAMVIDAYGRPFGPRGEYFDMAREAVEEALELLVQGDVLDSLEVWRQFEEREKKYEVQEGGPPPLYPLVGRLEVEIV